jgi:uncharacterized protein DUF3887
MIFGNRHWSSLALLLMGAVAASAQTDFQPQAKAVVTSFMAKKFVEVEAQFDPVLRAQLSKTKMLGVWLTLNSQFGDFQSIEKTDQKGARTVIVTCRFSRHTWDITVGFDSEGHVSEFILPPKGPQRPPAKKALSAVQGVSLIFPRPQAGR